MKDLNLKIEEAAEDKLQVGAINNHLIKEAFIEGAKSEAAKEYWLEQFKLNGLYNDEDMKDAFKNGELYADNGTYSINKGGGEALPFTKWFKIYKKKL